MYQLAKDVGLRSGNEQWGKLNSISTGGTTVTYSISFTEVYNVCSTAIHNGRFTATAWAGSITNSTCTLYGERWSDASYTAGISGAYWIALGK